MSKKVKLHKCEVCGLWYPMADMQGKNLCNACAWGDELEGVAQP